MTEVQCEHFKSRCVFFFGFKHFWQVSWIVQVVHSHSDVFQSIKFSQLLHVIESFVFWVLSANSSCGGSFLLFDLPLVFIYCGCLLYTGIIDIVSTYGGGFAKRLHEMCTSVGFSYTVDDVIAFLRFFLTTSACFLVSFFNGCVFGCCLFLIRRCYDLRICLSCCSSSCVCWCWRYCPRTVEIVLDCESIVLHSG